MKTGYVDIVPPSSYFLVIRNNLFGNKLNTCTIVSFPTVFFFIWHLLIFWNWYFLTILYKYVWYLLSYVIMLFFFDFWNYNLDQWSTLTDCNNMMALSLWKYISDCTFEVYYHLRSMLVCLYFWKDNLKSTFWL